MPWNYQQKEARELQAHLLDKYYSYYKLDGCNYNEGICSQLTVFHTKDNVLIQYDFDKTFSFCIPNDSKGNYVEYFWTGERWKLNSERSNLQDTNVDENFVYSDGKAFPFIAKDEEFYNMVLNDEPFSVTEKL